MCIIKPASLSGFVTRVKVFYVYAKFVKVEDSVLSKVRNGNALLSNY